LGGYTVQVTTELRPLLNDIKASATSTARLIALLELNDLLSFATED
jgi:hypothetical protein